MIIATIYFFQFKKLMNSMDPFEDKNSPEPMDSAKPTNPPVVQYSTGEGKDQAVSCVPSTVNGLGCNGT